ncbi:MAG: hypothetical protein ACLSAM_04945 [Alistipes onderdonkii]
MKHRIILLAIAALAAFEAAAARPRLVVNIVVGSMRAEDLGRYAGNYGEGGLRRLLDGARSSPTAATTTSRPRRPYRSPRSPRAPCLRRTA